MKRISLIILAVFSAVLSLPAQETTERYPSAGNWFVDIGNGMNVTFNDHRFGVGGFASEFRVGKWIAPDVAARFGVGGFLDAYHNEDTGWLDAAESRYQIRVSGDLIWDPVSTFAGYRSDRVFRFLPYARFSWIAAGPGKASNLEYAAGGGLKNTFRLDKKVDLCIDLSGVVERGLACRNDGRFVLFPTVTAGFTFRLGRQGFSRCRKDACGMPSPEVVERIVEVPVEKVVEKPVVVENHGGVGAVVVYFDLGSSVLAIIERSRLDAYVKAEGDRLRGAKLVVTGSADKETGNAEINRRLSEERVDHVVGLLVDYCGVNPKDITRRAIGDTANVGSPEQNRCVTVAYVYE